LQIKMRNIQPTIWGGIQFQTCALIKICPSFTAQNALGFECGCIRFYGQKWPEVCKKWKKNNWLRH